MSPMMARRLGRCVSVLAGISSRGGIWQISRGCAQGGESPEKGYEGRSKTGVQGQYQWAGMALFRTPVQASVHPAASHSRIDR